MAQFDVFVNPILGARRAYPYVVILQSDFASGARDSLVAPLVPRAGLSTVAGRLAPIVIVEGSEHAVLVPAMTGLRSADLSKRCASIASARDEVLAAIDHLFFGA